MPVEECAISILKRIVELQQERHSNFKCGHPSVRHFVVDIVELEVATNRITNELVDTVYEFDSTSGLQLDIVNFTDVRTDQPSQRSLMKSWLAAATGFQTEAKERKDANTRRTADGLPRPRRITTKGLSSRSFAAFCSNFMVAKGLDEIKIGGLDQMMTRPITHLSGREWCWLVFALFHETAQHSVTRLIIKVDELLLADIYPPDASLASSTGQTIRSKYYSTQAAVVSHSASSSGSS